VRGSQRRNDDGSGAAFYAEDFLHLLVGGCDDIQQVLGERQSLRAQSRVVHDRYVPRDADESCGVIKCGTCARGEWLSSRRTSSSVWQ